MNWASHWKHTTNKISHSPGSWEGHGQGVGRPGVPRELPPASDTAALSLWARGARAKDAAGISFVSKGTGHSLNKYPSLLSSIPRQNQKLILDHFQKQCWAKRLETGGKSIRIKIQNSKFPPQPGNHFQMNRTYQEEPREELAPEKWGRDRRKDLQRVLCSWPAASQHMPFSFAGLFLRVFLFLNKTSLLLFLTPTMVQSDRACNTQAPSITNTPNSDTSQHRRQSTQKYFPGNLSIVDRSSHPLLKCWCDSFCFENVNAVFPHSCTAVYTHMLKQH